MIPAFVGGLPGGMEFAVIFLNIVVLVAVGYVVLAVVRALSRSSTSNLEDRVANLEGQVDALREELRDRDEE
ncbi:hypothetical protein LPA44_00965 [Halobacterium sp. KA-4]|jgi:ABC-type lipoprotein release transport system permease subunit|uniref:hypothetical protein n=1 Tax=Halobacterium sp. KA-4 TaxID=2896367 RepID=UPI001E3DCE24|nr:hypothetical protein [Halobacterium sp. KA-4]MCD2198479.1 hypothetical protein [Halobacterium sp. KA-4]